jgi:hypothetical protein
MGKTPKADKKEKKVEEAGEAEERDYDVLVKGVNAIASPLASKKLTKKLYKVSGVRPGWWWWSWWGCVEWAVVGAVSLLRYRQCG